MPHIIINACDWGRNIRKIDIHAEITFSEVYYNDVARSTQKLKELQADLEKLIEKYFDADTYESYRYRKNWRYDHGLDSDD